MQNWSSILIAEITDIQFGPLFSKDWFSFDLETKKQANKVLEIWLVLRRLGERTCHFIGLFCRANNKRHIPKWRTHVKRWDREYEELWVQEQRENEWPLLYIYNVL